MKRRMFSTMLSLGLITASAGLLSAGSEKECMHSGGSISTNFLDPSTTFGTATGDLGGAIGVSVLSLKPNSDGTLTFHNQHHWVTSAGDTISVGDATATGFPTPIAGLFAISYGDGLKLTGGTGRFANATGHLKAYGAVDTEKGQVVLRYEGQVCLGEIEVH